MTLWWIGNLVFLAVIIPVVVRLLNSLLTPAKQIQQYADDVLEHGVLLIAELDDVELLVGTRDRVKLVSGAVQRYGRAVGQLA